MRTFLFNDIEFIGINSDESIPSDNPLFSNYHTFKFIEIDSRKKRPEPNTYSRSRHMQDVLRSSLSCHL